MQILCNCSGIDIILKLCIQGQKFAYFFVIYIAFNDIDICNHNERQTLGLGGHDNEQGIREKRECNI